MRKAALPALVLALVLVPGCFGGDGGDGDDGGSGGAASPSPASGPPTDAGPSTAPEALPGSCRELLPYEAVDEALGRQVPGRVTYVRAEPLPRIERTGRVTCGYGVRTVDGQDQPAAVEISLMTYADAGAAQARLDLTVQRARDEGNTVGEARAGDRPAFVLTSPASSTLVLVSGNRSLVVTALPGVVPEAQVADVLPMLADEVMSRLDEG